MKANFQFVCKTLLPAVLLISATVSAETRHVAVPSYLVKAGALVEVPVTLDNAAGLAALRIQLNYDPKVIDLELVKAGPLGEAFEFSHEMTEKGVTQLTFARADALAGGSGRLASLRFRANPGAVVDLVSELAVADVSLADATGVIDLRQKDALTVTNGELVVSSRTNIDNAGSGLPDWWELQHGLDPFALNAPYDSDGDGLVNLLEYAFGGNPRLADSGTRGMQSGRFRLNGYDFFRLGFYRRTDDSKLIFRVEESPLVGQWQLLPLPQQMIGTPIDQGDGTEYVEVFGTQPMNGPLAQPKGFMRVGVTRAK